MMPELPEVENFARSLHAAYAGSTLQKIEFCRPDLRFPFDQKNLKKIFAPRSLLLACERQGKSLILKTTHGSAQVGLGMSGAFFTRHLKDPRKLHEHVALYFTDGRVLVYVDPRRFGYWVVHSNLERAGTKEPPSSLAAVPCDALDSLALSTLFTSTAVQKMHRPVKVFLMDQNFIGGIGNIYACEALFRAGVHPFTACAHIKKAQWTKLAQVIPLLLQEAIEAGGSSISTYRTLQGKKGGFQNLHLVYGREGSECPTRRCKGTIVKSMVGNRGTWYCEVCQAADDAVNNQQFSGPCSVETAHPKK